MSSFIKIYLLPRGRLKDEITKLEKKAEFDIEDLKRRQNKVIMSEHISLMHFLLIKVILLYSSFVNDRFSLKTSVG